MAQPVNNQFTKFIEKRDLEFVAQIGDRAVKIEKDTATTNHIHVTYLFMGYVESEEWIRLECTDNFVNELIHNGWILVTANAPERNNA